MNIIKKTAVFFLAAIICLTGISIPHDKKIKARAYYPDEDCEQYLPIHGGEAFGNYPPVTWTLDTDHTLYINSNQEECYIPNEFFSDVYIYSEDPEENYSFEIYPSYLVEKIVFYDNIDDVFLAASAFQRFFNLKSVKFPDSAGSIFIGDQSFRDTKISSLSISAETVEISNSAFASCTELEDVYINAGNSCIISTSAFRECKKLEKVYLQNADISNKVFWQCDSLKEINLSGACKLNRYSVIDCPDLENINTEMENTEFDNTFADCPSLKTINNTPVTDTLTGDIDPEYRDMVFGSLTACYNVGFLTSYVKAQIKKTVEENINGDMTGAQKAKALHDWLCRKLSYNTRRNLPAAVDHSDETAFLNDYTQCEGYTRAYNLLLNQAGIPTCYVHSSNHAWNIAKIDGHFFHIDTTWDDRNDGISYDWFMKSDSELRSKGGDHAEWDLKYPSDMHSFQLKELPECPNPVGDVNLDEKFGIADLVVMNRYIVGDEKIASDDLVLADMDLDGRADSFDLCLMRQELLK